MKLCELCKHHYRESKCIGSYGAIEIHLVKLMCSKHDTKCEKVIKCLQYEEDPEILNGLLFAAENVLKEEDNNAID